MQTRMKQVGMRGAGGPEVLVIEDAPIPAPRAGQVLIEVRAAGINRPDIAQRKGLYPPPADASPVLGLEVAGVIVQADPGSNWKIGDRVCALTAGGGYAQYCVADSRHCLKIPASLSFEEAAGIPENYFTVWANVFQIAKLQAGERFLVHGGSSGIGTAAIQLAKARGAEVFTTAGSVAKCEACLSLGAAHAVNYKEEDFTESCKDIDVVLDMIGGSYLQKNITCLRKGGRIVQIATQAGKEATLDLMQVMQKRIVITGSTLRPRSNDEKAQIAVELEQEVMPLFEQKKLRVHIDQVFKFTDVAKAHAALEESKHIGKIILNGFSL